MAEKARITRRGMFATIGGAAVASVALAIPAGAAVRNDSSLTHEIIGAYFTLSNGERVDALRQMREKGMTEIADALERSIPWHRADSLEELTRRFVEDAKAIDPTIRAVWIGNDQLPEHRGEIFNVTFDRRRQTRRKRH